MTKHEKVIYKKKEYCLKIVLDCYGRCKSAQKNSRLSKRYDKNLEMYMGASLRRSKTE